MGEKLIHVKVYPGSTREGVEEEDGVLVVRVSAPPRAGKANRRLIELLSKHYRVPRSSIAIVKGFKSREKVVKIELGED